MKFKTYRNLFIGFIIIVAGGFLMQYLLSMKTVPESRKPPEKVRFVKAEQLTPANETVIINGYGKIESVQNIDIISEAKGQLYDTQGNLYEGAVFSDGDLLFSIDNEEASFRLLSKKSVFMKTLAQILPEMKFDYPQDFSIWQKYFANLDIAKPLPDLPQVSPGAKLYLHSKGIISDFYTLKAEETLYSKYEVFAPFDGTVTAVYANKGSVCMAGSKVIRISRTDSYEIRIALSPEESHWINPGMTAEIYNDNPDFFCTGKLARIGSVTDPQTQALPVFISVQNARCDFIRDGSYAHVSIAGATAQNVISLPRQAIFKDKFVWTVRSGKLASQETEVVKFTESAALIRCPQSTPEVFIVTESLPAAYEGMSVKVAGKTNSGE